MDDQQEKPDLICPFPAWITNTPALEIIEILGPDTTRMVGGCVRNMVMGAGATDVDLATKHTPDQVIARLEAAGLKVIPTGIDHGTVTAIRNGQAIEITTLRKDVATDGRRAVVSFSKDWKEDAERRDFTINALYFNALGGVFDVLGEGLRDAEAGSVRFIGDSNARIQEDYLRILRFFRFHALYGKGNPDPDAVRACKAHASGLSHISKERITQEVFKILNAENGFVVFDLMHKNNILKDFLCDLPKGRVLDRFKKAAPQGALFGLYAIIGGDIDLARQFLTMSRIQLKGLEAISCAQKELGLASGELDFKKAVYLHGYEAARAAMAYLCSMEDRAVPEWVFTLEGWVPPEFPLSGADLKAAGLKPGPKFKEYLAVTKEWWMAHDFKPDKEACLARLLQYVN